MRSMLTLSITIFCGLLSSCSSQLLESSYDVSKLPPSTIEVSEKSQNVLDKQGDLLLAENLSLKETDIIKKTKLTDDKQTQSIDLPNDNTLVEKSHEKSTQSTNFDKTLSPKVAPKNKQETYSGDTVKQLSERATVTGETNSNIATPVKTDIQKTGDKEKQPLKTVTHEKDKPAKKSIDPAKFQEFFAPEKYNHPLRFSKTLNFMIGEDGHGSYLYGEGPILEGAYDKFLKYVRHFEEKGVKLNRLMLHSPGGVLNEGIQIGNYLLENKWETDADQHMRCYSTCGFIYAAGETKRIQTGAEIGFHRPYIPSEPDTPEFIAAVYEEYKGYWTAVGADMELYEKFMREFGRDEMLILKTETIKKYIPVEAY